MSIKENVIQFMEGSGYTQKQVAAKSNLSTATVSQYLSGTYKGNISTTETKLRDFLFREAKRLHGDVEFGSCIQCVDCNVQYLLFCAGIRWLKLM